MQEGLTSGLRVGIQQLAVADMQRKGSKKEAKFYGQHLLDEFQSSEGVRDMRREGERDNSRAKLINPLGSASHGDGDQGSTTATKGWVRSVTISFQGATQQRIMLSRDLRSAAAPTPWARCP